MRNNMNEEKSFIEEGRMYISIYSSWSDLLRVLFENGYGVDIEIKKSDHVPMLIIDYRKEFAEESE